jgi:hypothetical protein
MATKADFTEQEWEALQKGVTGAGFMTAISDRSFFDSFKEAGALARHMGEARQAGESELVRELGETRGTGFGITDSPEEIETETMAALRQALQVLEQKAPDEVEAYKAFVVEVAQSVGNAAGGGETAEAETV